MNEVVKKLLNGLQMRTIAFKNDSATVLLLAERLQQANLLLDEWLRFSKGLKSNENPESNDPAVPATPPAASGEHCP